MTSKVTVQCHDYPVLVEGMDYQNNNPSSNDHRVLQVVNPGETKDFTLHSSVQFRITELPQRVD